MPDVTTDTEPGTPICVTLVDGRTCSGRLIELRFDGDASGMVMDVDGAVVSFRSTDVKRSETTDGVEPCCGDG